MCRCRSASVQIITGIKVPFPGLSRLFFCLKGEVLSQFGAYQPHYWNYGLLCCLATVFIAAPLFGIMGYYVASQLYNLVVSCLTTVSFGCRCLATVFMAIMLPRNCIIWLLVASQLYYLVIVASQRYS